MSLISKGLSPIYHIFSYKTKLNIEYGLSLWGNIPKLKLKIILVKYFMRTKLNEMNHASKTKY